MAGRKAIFFLRAYPDIDHITPVIYKFVTATTAKAEVVLLPGTANESDYRISFLQELDGVTVHDGDDFRSSVDRARVKSRRETIGLAKRFGRGLPSDLPKRLWDNLLPYRVNHPTFPDPDTIYESLDDGNETIVVTDWPPIREYPVGEFVDGVVTGARQRGYPCLSLPHGDAGLCNYLIHDVVLEQYDYDFEGVQLDDVIDTQPKVSGYDWYVFPNEPMTRILKAVDEPKESAVLGSARYNEEWINKASVLSPDFQPNLNLDGINVVFFVPKRTVPVHWDELPQSIRIIGKIPGVNLVVKGHPRSTYEEVEEFAETEAENVMIENDEHSISLLKWADVVLGIASSITFEAVVRDIPVGIPEYLHPNRSTVADRMPACQLDSRDDLYRMIHEHRTGDRERTYSREDRNRFIDELLTGPTDDVLTGYADFLFERFESSGLETT